MPNPASPALALGAAFPAHWERRSQSAAGQGVPPLRSLSPFVLTPGGEEAF